MNKRFSKLVALIITSLLTGSAMAQGWTQLTPSGTPPSPRGFHGVTGMYDPGSNRMIVFGGRDTAGNNLNDLWVLTNANGLAGSGQWINLIPNGAPGSPAPRSGHSAVYDATNNRMIIFGGCGGYCLPTFNDVWVLTNANGLGGTPTWAQLVPGGPSPDGRVKPAAVYDQSNNRMIVFAGQNGGGFGCATFSEVWVLTNANGLGGLPIWSMLNPSGGPPPGQYAPTAIFDNATNHVTVFGGGGMVNGACQFSNGAWVLSNANGLGGSPAWTNLTAESGIGSPPSRTNHSAVYRAISNQMTIFGGNNGTGSLGDAWTLSNANGVGTPSWTQVVPSGVTPKARDSHAAMLDSINNRMTIFGGDSSGTTFFNDSWVLSLNSNQGPILSVNRKTLNFGYSGAQITSPQTVLVNITNPPGVGWTAMSNQSNIMISPSSGVGSGSFQVTVAPGPSGLITVSANGASSSPQQITVNVRNVIASMPFGSFDTPTNNTTGVTGAIGITGWALDNIEVTSVGIWRTPVPGEAAASNGLVFIGNANFVPDARPDIAVSFPSYSYQYRGGWGYQMLTNFLPNASGSGQVGNGTYNLHAIATNASGTTVDLGMRTITVDNAHASKPFGSIDTPDQGGSATGNTFVNFGWALTQNPFAVPLDGSTITVILDGTPVGHSTYNNFRSDIANLFTGLANSNGAVGFFLIDTTKLTNGVHTISWNVCDNGARCAGLGSRYFSVLNANGGGVAAPEELPTSESQAGPVRLRSGIDLNAPEVPLAADLDGAISIEMEQFGRIELSLGASKGYLVVGDQAQDLPLGSSLKGGVFYWQPPPGFLGKYQLLFERPDRMQTTVHVNIVPDQYFMQ